VFDFSTGKPVLTEISDEVTIEEIEKFTEFEFDVSCML
jgi:acyl CoA:acetate/3-ketoacid CoA transferase beta subunit